MSTVGGYVHDVSGGASATIDLRVLCFTDEVRLSVTPSTLGREVRKMVSENFPPKPGVQIALCHMESPLVHGKSLQEQGVVGPAATLSCAFVPTNLYAAWRYVQRVLADEFALEGVTQLHGVASGSYLHHLPRSLESLAFGAWFNQSLDRVAFPVSLRSLAFGVSLQPWLRGCCPASKPSTPNVWC